MRTLLLLAVIGLASACGDDVQVAQDAHPADAGVDSDESATDAGCFTNPQTHRELINACTGAEKVFKSPTLPNLLPDGGLPPVP